MRRLFDRRGILAVLLGGMLGATISIGAVGYADQAAAPVPHATAAAPRPGGIIGGIHQLLDNLVRQGVITQRQADAVQRQANAGSINPKELVQSGVVTDAQMHTIANGVLQLKQADR